jgi:flagellar hook-basal body complex protein FliE
MTTIDTSGLLAMRSSILQQNSALQKANGVGALGAAEGVEKTTDFGRAFRGALNQVNAMQSQSNNISESYERGDTTDIAAVMLAREQASVGFQATLQVRNKLLSAYRDIMSMPV